MSGLPTESVGENHHLKKVAEEIRTLNMAVPKYVVENVTIHSTTFVENL